MLSAVTRQSERGLQAAEACVRQGASELPDALLFSPDNGWWYAVGLLGTVAAGGRCCGLQAALRLPRLQGYGSGVRFCFARIVWGAVWALGIAGAAAAGFQYEFQAGRSYVYAVRAVAEERDYLELLTGTVAYSVKAVATAGNEIALASRPALVRQRETANGLVVPFADTPGRTALRVGGYRFIESGPAAGSEVQIDWQGRTPRAAAGAAGSRMLGEVARLIIDPLLPAGKQSWSTSGDCELVWEEAVPATRVNPEPRVREVRVPAREQVLYTLENVGDEVVVFKRQYELRTAPAANGGRRMVLSGAGTNTFALVRGLPVAMNFTGVLTETWENGERRTPLSVSYKLLEGADLAALAPGSKTAGTAAGRAALKRLTTVEHAKLLADLLGEDRLKQRAAAGRLAGFQPAGNRAEIVRRLVALAGSEEGFMREAAIKALAVWGTPAQANVVLEALQDRDLAVRQAAIEALAAGRTARGAEALAELVATGREFSQASLALRGMGAVAEPAVLKLLAERNATTRREACQLLKVIGTQQSLPALDEAARAPDALLALLAKEAIKAVTGRGEKLQD